MLDETGESMRAPALTGPGEAQVIELEAGKFPVDQAIGRIISFEEAPSALREWAEDPSRFGKIIVQINSGNL